MKFLNFIIERTKEIKDYEIYDLELRRFSLGRVLEYSVRNKKYKFSFIIIQDIKTLRTIIKMVKAEPPFPFYEFIKTKGPLYQISPVFKNFLYHPLNFAYIDKGKFIERRIEKIKEINDDVFKEWIRLGMKFFKYKLVVKKKFTLFENKITVLVPKGEPIKIVPVFIGEKVLSLLNYSV